MNHCSIDWNEECASQEELAYLPDGRPCNKIVFLHTDMVSAAIMSTIRNKPHHLIGDVYSVYLNTVQVEPLVCIDSFTPDVKKDIIRVGRIVKEYFQYLSIYIITWMKEDFGYSADGQMKFMPDSLQHSTMITYDFQKGCMDGGEYGEAEDDHGFELMVRDL